VGGLFFLLMLCVAWPISVTMAEELDYAVGADVSFLADAESRGIVFREDGQPKPGLQILKDHGYNWIRLRLFHTPRRLPNDLEYTLAAAQEAKSLGFRVLLNFHYSDTWADPGKQYLPKAWEGMDHDQLTQAVFEYTRDTIAAFRDAGDLTQAVFEYTRDTIAAFRDAGVLPEMVQIGNEVIAGMMWPDGKLPDRWPEFADLLKAGIRGVKEGAGDAPRPQIMIHIDRGGDRSRTKYFFDHCREYGVEFDVIGQSYYPWWHGTLDDLEQNLDFMAREFGKDIYLVEVAYNWRPAEYRDKPGPFPESPEGQRDFLASVNEIVRRTPEGRGKGIFWWEPAVRPGAIYSRGIFDDEGNVLPVIGVFDSQ
jgi:arabinogalactan endo-1,4-beta-galactosidase